MFKPFTFICAALVPLALTGCASAGGPSASGSSALDRGIMFAERGGYDMAVEEFTQAIKLDPDNAAAYYNRGDAYKNKGDNDRAIADFSQAVKLDPNDADYKANLERARNMRGR